MKTKFLILVLAGVFTFSCGSKDNKKEEVVPEKQVYNHTVTWTAFKTPEKIGVSGTFATSELSKLTESDILLNALDGAKFSIVTASVSTKDDDRDAKLKVSFFAQMNGDISGYFGTFKDGKVPVFITMNGVTKEKEFSYEATENSVKINGSIDIVSDFKADKALQTIHEICKDLHVGKTWSDVTIDVEITKE